MGCLSLRIRNACSSALNTIGFQSRTNNIPAAHLPLGLCLLQLLCRFPCFFWSFDWF